MVPEISDSLSHLVVSSRDFRRELDRVMSSSPVSSGAARRLLLQLLERAANLYLSSITVLLILFDNDDSSQALEDGLHQDEPDSAAIRVADLFRIDSHEHRSARERIGIMFASWPCWSCFRPQNNAQAEASGLRTLDDYQFSFAHHLPEVYQEALRVAKIATYLIENPNSRADGALIVALEHLALNHLSFLNPALQWASTEGVWEESS